MFVQFNYTNFPNVYVTFGKLNSTYCSNILTSEWLRLYVVYLLLLYLMHLI